MEKDIFTERRRMLADMILNNELYVPITIIIIISIHHLVISIVIVSIIIIKLILILD